jgi:hypothetical protein
VKSPKEPNHSGAHGEFLLLTAQTAVEGELVLRLASLLWRSRRATTMETGLFEIRADHLGGYNQPSQVCPGSGEILSALFGQAG